MVQFYLQHRTNYWGGEVDADDGDPEVDCEVIWMQLSDRHRGCCPGFGERSIYLGNNGRYLEDKAYRIWKVSETQGRKKNHYFYKFVAIPEKKQMYGRVRCERRGWEFEGEIQGHSAVSDLKELLGHYKEDGKRENNHLHIGFAIDTLKTR